MNAQKIADGAYFVPAYSEQTIAWSPLGYTVQCLASEESTEEIKSDTKDIQIEETV